MGEAVGFLEVYGLVTAFAAADAACKAANVTIEAFDRNKPANSEKLPVPLVIIVKIRGGISDVTAAIQAGTQAAEAHAGFLTTHIIAKPEADTEKLLRINELK